MKAVLNDVVIAEAPKDDLISIEGKWYFPPSSVKPGHLTESATPYTCPWKGACQYFTVAAHSAGSGREVSLQDRAWSYPDPIPSSFERVGQDYSNYIAFWKEVQVID